MISGSGKTVLPSRTARTESLLLGEVNSIEPTAEVPIEGVITPCPDAGGSAASIRRVGLDEEIGSVPASACSIAYRD